MTSIALPRVRAAARSRDRAAWERPALVAVLALAAFLVLYRLTASGYSNTYYAAAVRSATESWKALFFGSIDPGSFITVDKPPLSIWLMALSGRVLGFSSFSMLLPQALCTVAAVGVLYATVKRLFGPMAATLAALALALTPITVAIGRVNNPDALLVLLLVVSAYLTVRAIESGRTRPLVWAGVVVGLAFMTKMLQGWMVVPALAAAYLLAGRPALGIRVKQLVLAGGAMVAASAAWPLAVTLWPGSAPYIGGSEDGSVWNLILGYNGFGRLTGSEGGMGGGGAPTFGGVAGLWRMFNAQVGGQVAWLLPAAAVALVAGLYLTRRAERTDRTRAGLVLFGVWALVHVVVFSFQKGIFHPYYVSALAPAVAALAGAGAALVGRWAKASFYGVLAAAIGVGLTAEVALLILGRTADFQPWLRVAIPVAAAIAVVALVADAKRLRWLAALAAAVAVLAGPASYTLATTGKGLNGNNVLAGPGGTDSGFGGPGGADMGAGTDSAAIGYLITHQGSAKYLVAVSGSQAAAPIILRTGKAVVTMGGFSGSDPTPTAAQLAEMVRNGEVRYAMVGGGFGGRGGSSDVTAWITAHGKEVSGVSGLYELSA